MGKGAQTTQQTTTQTDRDLSRMVASVDRLARVRDYLRDTRDVTGTVTQLTALIDEARLASGQASVPASSPVINTPPIRADGAAALKMAQQQNAMAAASSSSAVRQQSSTEKGARMGVGVAHSFGSAVLGAFGMGGLAPAIGQAEGFALDLAFNGNG